MQRGPRLNPWLLLAPMAGGLCAHGAVYPVDTFSTARAAAPAGWTTRSFAGHTEYRVVHDANNACLHAHARGAASGLFRRVDVDLARYPRLRWRWKVTRLPAGGDSRQRRSDDAAARVYVVFPARIPWRTRTLNYLWANRLPVGAVVPNPWLPDNAMVIAAQSGPARLGHWVEEVHDVVADYRRAFGSDPPRPRAIAVMTDADNTGSEAEAYYDDFAFLAAP